MTYEKAVQALVAAGLLDKAQMDTAVAALKQTNVEFTYPAWAEALEKAGLISENDVGTATDVMQKAGQAEAENDPDGFNKSLEDASLL